jgi:dolichol kinase
MSNCTQFKACKRAGFASDRSHEHHKNLGMLLLAIYLILVGITLLLHITIPVIIMGILALAAGILILIGK